MIYTDLQASGFDQTSVAIDMNSQPMLSDDSGTNGEGFSSVLLPGSNEETDIPA